MDVQQQKPQSTIELFEAIYDHKDSILEVDSAYYHIAAAAYDTWVKSESVFENTLANRLKHMVSQWFQEDYEPLRYKEYTVEANYLIWKKQAAHLQMYNNNSLLCDAIRHVVAHLHSQNKNPL